MAAMDKETYPVNEAPESPSSNGHAHNTYVDPESGIETKSGRMHEAADVYGDMETAEEYGYVTRGCVSTLARNPLGSC